MKYLVTFAHMNNTGKKQEYRERTYTLTEKQLYEFGEHIANTAIKKMMDETFISRAEASRMLNVSNQTMTSWEKKGILKASSNVGNRYMYRLSDINSLKGKLTKA